MTDAGTLAEAAGAGNRPEEHDLLARFLSGDAAALRIVDRWAREVVHYEYRRLLQHEADDIVQDTVIGLWRAASRRDFAVRKDLRALVRRIALRRCIDRLRQWRPSVELDESLADDRRPPYEELLRKDERARLRWALMQLDRDCQDLIRRRYIEGRRYAELAADAGLAESSLRGRMFRCLKRVRRLIVG